MLEHIDTSLIDWSRAQFALTAIYHWIFVPLTLGLAVIMGIMETMYYRTGDEFWKRTAKFWMKLFGINFAIGVATGLILEFEFGTNWSNYSWFVGDIFGAPLAIEGILAFFMEATFIAVMFFGWDKVSKKFHLASTWLTGLGATISAWWILVANAWMQNPVGMEFNPDTVRNEMVDFWAVALSPTAVNKFFHTVLSGWVLGAVFVVGVACWFLLKKRNKKFALSSIKIAAWVGLVSALLSAWTGDGSGYQVAQTQPMKLAAMEGYYEGQQGAGLVAIGMLNPEKKTYNDGQDPFLFRIEIPKMLSLLAERKLDGFVPGITDLIEGGYQLKDGTQALSAEEKIERGKTAIGALAAYRAAQAADNDAEAVEAAKAAAEKGIQVSVLGVGMPDGAPIPVEGTNDFRRDRDGNVVVTRLNEQMCQEIAQAGDGIYVRVDNSNAAQKVIAQEINKMAKADVETQVYTEFNEQFQAVAWIILLLLLAEMLILERKNPLFRNIHLFKKEERYDDEK